LTPTPPPQLTLAQRHLALLKAQQSRQERAEVKRQITSGKLTIFDAINDPRESIRRMKVLELLTALPGVGKSRATLIMERRRISPTRRIGGLGHLQLRALGKELAVSKVEPTRGNLVVISGPGGVGKSTIAASLRNDPRFWVSVSATTRLPRPGERDGVDYFFYDEEKFTNLIGSGDFLEWAEFEGYKYGTPRAPVEEWRSLGKHVILEIEVDGARQVRTREPRSILIFIAPPSWDELVRRLTGRGTDSPERRAVRLSRAEQEMASSSEFDAVLVNDQVDALIAQLVPLATA
jgi:guanylate kinase